MLGLTSQEAEARLHQGLGNEQVDSSTRTVKEIVKENVLTYYNLIFTVLAVLLIIVGQFRDLTFMFIVFANTAIGIAQEIRSKQTLDKLKLLKMPKVHVLRDGHEVQIPVEQLVLEDCIILGAGSQIPADAEVVDGSIQVNEALITGESDEITKTRGAQLLSGSFVISGHCVARLTAVGRESYISKLTIEATKDKKGEQSEMIKSLDWLVKIIGIIIIPVGITLFVQQCFILDGGFTDSITSMVAAVLGMIPEGLYMTASIAMVVSAMRLAKKDVLVQNMRCIETLARVDVLCVDKTGTITENEMKVCGMQPMVDASHEDVLYGMIGDLVAVQSSDNITMAAMKEYFAKPEGKQVDSICPFSSKYKYCGAVFSDGNYVLGAPEFVLRERFAQYENYITDLSEQGYRVLAFCQTEDIPDGQPLEGDARLLALIYLTNPIRKSAPETFQYFADNGVDIKVISGDNPVTVSNVAMEAGIKDADRYIDARQLVNQRAIFEAVERYTVFGRVTPEQKRMFVKALKKQGKTVGMTGDGVNDILALRDADCSIAIASGSEAASNAAQLVLMDSDFSKMPSVVEEGRRVVNNIEKSASLFLTKNIFSLLLALFSMISVLSYPLKPSQITLISMFTIGMPSFVLSLEPNKNLIKGTFFGNVFKMAAPAGITTFISVSSLVIFGQVFEIDPVCISTSCTILVGLVGFMILGKIARPFNALHTALIAVMVGGMAFCTFFMPDLFGINSISGQAAMLLVVFLIATEALFRYIYKFTSLCGRIMSHTPRRKKKEQKH
ncbi:cation-translocating P-type ATPase [Ihubacter sp. rT4E-8]|uniref:cation-translocating P-type ATPase n=1 Tax=unclassified Ihubacter TaxID=2633299 RepID=UPI003C7CAACE